MKDGDEERMAYRHITEGATAQLTRTRGTGNDALPVSGGKFPYRTLIRMCRPADLEASLQTWFRFLDHSVVYGDPTTDNNDIIGLIPWMKKHQEDARLILPGFQIDRALEKTARRFRQHPSELVWFISAACVPSDLGEFTPIEWAISRIRKQYPRMPQDLSPDPIWVAIVPGSTHFVLTAARQRVWMEWLTEPTTAVTDRGHTEASIRIKTRELRKSNPEEYYKDLPPGSWTPDLWVEIYGDMALVIDLALGDQGLCLVQPDTREWPESPPEDQAVDNREGEVPWPFAPRPSDKAWISDTSIRVFPDEDSST